MRPPGRWLIITQYYAPEIGAPQIRLRSVVKELSRLGADVTVLTGMPNYPKGKKFAAYRYKIFMRERIDGITVHRVWMYAGSGKSTLTRLLNYLSFSLMAMPLALLGRRQDVVFIEGQPLSLGIAGILLKCFRGIPFIYNMPDLQVDVARQLGFIRRERLLDYAQSLEKSIIDRCWKVSTVSNGFIHRLQESGLPRSRITFLPNGADAVAFHPKAANTRLLRRWSLHGKKVFLYVGTHAYYHGLDTLVDAARILAHDTNIVFLLVGEGPERERLMVLAEQQKLTNIVFGSSPYRERVDLYSIAYAPIALLRDLPVAEMMRPAKIFPSLSCGVPVIYSGTGETAELLEEYECGIAVPPEDPESLASAILTSTANETSMRTMGMAGRKLVESSYNWPTIVQNWIDEIGPIPRHAPTTPVRPSKN